MVSGINLTRQSGKILTHRQILLTSWPVGGNGIVTLTGSNPSRGEPPIVTQLGKRREAGAMHFDVRRHA